MGTGCRVCAVSALFIFVVFWRQSCPGTSVPTPDMSQVFHVIRCYQCQTFQVQQVKKVSRWSCRLCGEKQSLLKEFGRGSGADCRRHVQKLNAERGAALEQDDPTTREAPEDHRERAEHTHTPVSRCVYSQVTRGQVSRWSKYLEDTVEEPEDRRGFVGESGPLIGDAHPPAAIAPGLDRLGAASGRPLTVASARTPTRTPSLLPVSAMFDSGDDFGCDL